MDSIEFSYKANTVIFIYTMKQTKQYEYVDLGLPSGLKWAKCNIGAEKETNYGNYFMWAAWLLYYA